MKRRAWIPDQLDGRRLQGFAMVHSSGAEMVAQALQEGKLRARDPGLLWALVPHMQFPLGHDSGLLDPNYPEAESKQRLQESRPTPPGRIVVRLSVVAAEIGQPRDEVTRAFARLQRAQLVARCRDRSGRSFFLINPEVVSVGGLSIRNRLWREFREATGGQATPQILEEIAPATAAAAAA